MSLASHSINRRGWVCGEEPLSHIWDDCAVSQVHHKVAKKPRQALVTSLRRPDPRLPAMGSCPGWALSVATQTEPRFGKAKRQISKGHSCEGIWSSWQNMCHNSLLCVQHSTAKQSLACTVVNGASLDIITVAELSPSSQGPSCEPTVIVYHWNI